ncbi:MAG: hypothetical protein AAF657_08745 [Acidobacteriota bacterium]
MPDRSRRMLCRFALLTITVTLCGSFLSAVGEAQQRGKSRDMSGFQVVIHTANPVEELEANDVAKMFQQKVRRWEHREKVVPVDLIQISEVRERFTRAIHGKSVTAIESFWQRIIFSGRGKPPEQKQTEAEVLTFVSEHPGGIGYVSDSMELVPGVKKLKITP